MIIKDLEYLENMELESSNTFGSATAFAFSIIDATGQRIEFAGSSSDPLSDFNIVLPDIGQGSATFFSLPFAWGTIVGTPANANGCNANG